ncbi:MAG: zinc ribbon domain-containing protein [Candidatus Wallbacteria bacterium]|nr:zinc ribbon domain-containing protein [Candidatus Wallbacteria bacterium]
MIRCQACQRTVADGFNFCPYCGSEFSAEKIASENSLSGKPVHFPKDYWRRALVTVNRAWRLVLSSLNDYMVACLITATAYILLKLVLGYNPSVMDRQTTFAEAGLAPQIRNIMLIMLPFFALETVHCMFYSMHIAGLRGSRPCISDFLSSFRRRPFSP